MSQIKIKPILDSINPFGNRLTTFELEIPKFILAQLNTHRQLSRNAASSRAIPLAKFRELATYIPETWMANGKGMSPSEEASAHYSYLASSEFEVVREVAKQSHTCMENYGIHKEQANRLLEPFTMVKVLVSATEWDNFLNLRLDDGAQSEIREVAEGIGKYLIDKLPAKVEWGVWHRPFHESYRYTVGPDVSTISGARCARISYLSHDGLSDSDKDLELGNRLIQSKHLSPFEHVAVAIPGSHSNFKGWCQYRSFLYDNSVVDKSWKEKIK